MKLRLSIAASALVAAAVGHGAARADLVSLWARAQGGGSSGAGLAGDQKDEAFHKGAEGLAYGAAVGVEVLLLDVWVEHDQYVRGELSGTWTQFMTGFDVELDLGPKKGGVRNDLGGVDGGISSGYAELGMAVGFGLGTGQQVDPPLDNSQVTDKGFLGQLHAGAGWRLTPSWSLGVLVPVQVGYLFKSGPGATANDLSTQYAQVSAAALLNLRLKIQLK
ncbi:MAG TPA: hypothetical protein VKZ63_05400 [Kofleriaceae bacterium]|nr:hypothetical protein [Kofleriaceae bacterium]